mmetsp:Transcript_44839/g.95434  ORF Transcript_44839/g.95434 Transcript_44839/m.95434 type:complete len:314 (+) Transcript_44839:52-993(+)
MNPLQTNPTPANISSRFRQIRPSSLYHHETHHTYKRQTRTTDLRKFSSLAPRRARRGKTDLPPDTFQPTTAPLDWLRRASIALRVPPSGFRPPPPKISPPLNEKPSQGDVPLELPRFRSLGGAGSLGGLGRLGQSRGFRRLGRLRQSRGLRSLRRSRGLRSLRRARCLGGLGRSRCLGGLGSLGGLGCSRRLGGLWRLRQLGCLGRLRGLGVRPAGLFPAGVRPHLSVADDEESLARPQRHAQREFGEESTFVGVGPAVVGFGLGRLGLRAAEGAASRQEELRGGGGGEEGDAGDAGDGGGGGEEGGGRRLHR